jgi:hypothetical protein
MFKTAHGEIRILPDERAVKRTSVDPPGERAQAITAMKVRERWELSLRACTCPKLTSSEIDCDTPPARTGRGKMVSEDTPFVRYGRELPKGET